MRCPFCHQDHDKVIDSRSSNNGVAIRRRRVCLNPECGKRYTTYERAERAGRLVVVKKDGSRVTFDANRVLRGIHAACGKRPVSEETKDCIVEEVEAEVHREFDREVPSEAIGRLVATKLRGIDQISYIRYASEYYNFETLGELEKEIGTLREQARELPNQEDLFG